VAAGHFSLFSSEPGLQLFNLVLERKLETSGAFSFAYLDFENSFDFIDLFGIDLLDHFVDTLVSFFSGAG
jgi:hypothetical protein